MEPMTDEFSFLPAVAAQWQLDTPAPAGERLTLTLEDGRELSAIRYLPPGATADDVRVTLLHGAALNAHTWDATVLALGEPALAIDLAGHGDSSWRDDATYSAETLAPDVIAALEAWTTQPQTLVGQSLGGLTALAVASATPRLVRDLVIVDILPGIDTSGLRAHLGAFFAQTEWPSRDALVDHALAFSLGGSRESAERGVFHNSRVRPDGVVEWKHHLAKLVADGAPNLLTASDADAAWHTVEHLTTPITLVRGEQGIVPEAAAETFAQKAPKAQVITLPAGHNVQEELPLELAALIRDVDR